MSETNPVTRQQIAAGLRELGVRPGMKLMVHASLSRFGRVAGGALAVIAALQEAVSERGTILMPSFNHGAPFQRGAEGAYDPRETPSLSGAISDAFWRLPGVRRSLHPTHPFACWGHDADRYTRAHHRTLTLGPGSPLGMLAREGGHGLFLGTGYSTNTLHHVAEYLERSLCLAWRTRVLPVRLPTGEWTQGRAWAYRAEPCPHNDLARYAPRMRQAGLERRGRIGSSPVVLFELQACLTVIRQLLREGDAAHPPCGRCPIRPRDEEIDAPSDWDAKRDALHPASGSWQY